MALGRVRNVVLLQKEINCLNFNQIISVVSTRGIYKDSRRSPLESEEKETHTGQKWDRDDYRLARFVDRPKQVNTNFAIDLIDEEPPENKKERVVWCDGGGGPTGHPKVYINLDKPGNHACGYCGLRFEKEAH